MVVPVEFGQQFANDGIAKVILTTYGTRQANDAVNATLNEFVEILIGSLGTNQSAKISEMLIKVRLGTLKTEDEAQHAALQAQDTLDQTPVPTIRCRPEDVATS
ncbi:MAG: hypothetical protein H6978_09780 [Gammaproteobacteria bacterium]|nr:hypothetical protein [Gammaproteobacteria bacterium]